MNLQETLELIKALNAAGVTKFKSLEHDIVLDARQASPNQLAPKKPVEPDAVDYPVAENPEAIQKAKDLINLARMSPEELANQIFPDGAM